MKITRTRAIFVKMSYFAPLALTLKKLLLNSD